MEFGEDRDGGFLIISPSGRLDSSNAAAFGDALTDRIEKGDAKLVIDFANLHYISSAGLRSLLVAGKKAQAAQGNVVLCALNEPVREVLEVSGFLSIFSVYPSRRDAVSAG